MVSIGVILIMDSTIYKERNDRPANEKDSAYLATFSSNSRRARCAARGLVVVVMVMRINEVIIEVLMGPHGFMHAVTWSSCHGRAGKFSLPACHAAFKASTRHASHGRGRYPGSVWAATGGPHMTSAS